MQLRKTKRGYGCDLNIAPLIDVVFLLIIFFMTISQISRVEAEHLALPEAASGELPEPRLGGRLIINVHQDGRIGVAGETHTLASLRRRLAAELAGRDPGDLEIVIRGDRDTAWEHPARVIQACAAEGLYRVRVACLEPESGKR